MMASLKMAGCLMAILLLAMSSVDAQSKKDRAKSKERQSANRERPVETLENVCDIQAATTGMYCYCDSLKLHDAHTANCWVFNATSQMDLIWHSFQTQTQLQELRLNVRRDDGRLTFVPTSALQHLGNLSILELAYADINVLEANSFNGLASVRNLSLKRNNINELRPGAFQGLTQLYDLVLSENQIKSIERGHLTGLDELRVLLLDQNSINLLADESFAPLHQLIELDLSENNISVLTSETLSGLDNLQSLYLQQNQLSIIGDGTFTRVPRLRHLELQSNQIRVIRDASFEALTQLAYLNLQGNQLVELAERTWNPTPSLMHLNLKNNQLDSVNQSAFRPIWSNLMDPSMFLAISGNPLTCHCGLEWLGRLHQTSASSTVKSAVESLTCQLADRHVPVKETVAQMECQLPTTVKSSGRTNHRRKSTTAHQPPTTPTTEASTAESVESTPATTSRSTFRYESVASHSLEATQQLASSNSSKRVGPSSSSSSSSSQSNLRVDAAQWATIVSAVWILNGRI